MLLAPLVGAMLGLLVSTVPAVVGLLSPEHRTRTSVDLLTSVLSVGLLALLTRGLHLDGLALGARFRGNSNFNHGLVYAGGGRAWEQVFCWKGYEKNWGPRTRGMFACYPSTRFP